jgi:hypothetical protein
MQSQARWSRKLISTKSIDDTAVLLDAVLRHMPAFAEELGWEK